MDDPPRVRAERHKPERQRRSKLDGFSPQQREKIAQWLEGKLPNVKRQIMLGTRYLQEHPEDWVQVNQLRYWTAYVSVVAHLAYLVRTERVRDADGVPVE